MHFIEGIRYGDSRLTFERRGMGWRVLGSRFGADCSQLRGRCLGSGGLEFLTMGYFLGKDAFGSVHTHTYIYIYIHLSVYTYRQGD